MVKLQFKTEKIMKTKRLSWTFLMKPNEEEGLFHPKLIVCSWSSKAKLRMFRSKIFVEAWGTKVLSTKRNLVRKNIIQLQVFRTWSSSRRDWVLQDLLLVKNRISKQEKNVTHLPRKPDQRMKMAWEAELRVSRSLLALINLLSPIPSLSMQ